MAKVPTTPRLAGLPLFAEVDGELLDGLSKIGVRRDVPARTTLIRQGELARRLVVVESGMTATLLHFAGIDDVLVETAAAPARIYGAAVFRPPHRHIATVRAEEPCSTIEFPAQPLRDLLATRSDWHARILVLLTAAQIARLRAAQRVAATTAGDATTTSEVLLDAP